MKKPDYRRMDRRLEDVEAYLSNIRDDESELQAWADEESERADKAEGEVESLKEELRNA